jgi:hypothetical protein
VSRISALALAIALVVSVTAWMIAADRPGDLPPGDFTPQPPAEWVTSPEVRNDALRRAALKPSAPPAAFAPAASAARDILTCNYFDDGPSGTSPKFSCVLPDGQVLKIKYGRNPEIQAEVAASALLHTLGYAADSVTIVPRVRCYGCPRFPYLAMRLRESPLTSRLLPARYEGAYTDFDEVSAERRFPAAAIETTTTKGWGWWELKDSLADRAELDAFRLLALFLAHWDNKSENQRLVCLDSAGSAKQDPAYTLTPPNPPHPPQAGCATPLLMIQDLGATFGPYKVNLTAWWDAPIWADAATCVATMRTLPFGGSTFKDVQISEEGRRLMLDQLAALSDADIRAIFTAAQFPDYQISTDDERDLQKWTAAFRHRQQMIDDGGPCLPRGPQ